MSQIGKATDGACRPVLSPVAQAVHSGLYACEYSQLSRKNAVWEGLARVSTRSSRAPRTGRSPLAFASFAGLVRFAKGEVFFYSSGARSSRRRDERSRRHRPRPALRRDCRLKKVAGMNHMGV